MNKRDAAAVKAWERAPRPAPTVVREHSPITSETISNGVVVGFFKILLWLILLPLGFIAALLVLSAIMSDVR